MRAWSTIAPAGARVDRADCIRSRRRTQAYRLALRNGGMSVIAKRARSDAVLLERTLYESVLPRLPLPALRYLGFVDEEEGDFGWLFIEDAGDRRCGPVKHQRLLARWLGTLHGAAATLDLPSCLPERGPDHYLGHLRAARATIIDSLDNPALPARDRDMLRSLTSTCEQIESGWSGVEAICVELPRTLVHGDLAHRHLRLRRDKAGPSILAFDWEWSGRGVPAADVHLLAGATPNDLACYRSAMSDHVGTVDGDELQALLRVGNGFRLLACADWVSTDLPYPQPEYAVEALRLYEQPLRAWAAELASTA